MRVVIHHSGSFDKTKSFLKNANERRIFAALDAIAAEGVNALAAATPKDTGETAALWTYEIRRTGGSYIISWTNSHVVDGANIAFLLQQGHGTGTGGYVQGRDYINPTMRPIFDKMADKAWKAVTSA